MQDERDDDVRVPLRVTFLMQNSYGGGGIARTVANLANSLAATHQVEVISMFRWRRAPNFRLDPRVVNTVLFDYSSAPGVAPRPREDPSAKPARRRLDERESDLYDGGGAKSAPASALTDRVLRRRLATMRPGVLISTRPSLHLAAARWSPPWVIRVAQDHLNYPGRLRDPRLIGTIDEASRRLDAFVTLTYDDERDYTERWAPQPRRPHVVRIPNASPFTPVERAGLEEKVVISAGRLEARKGFARVVEAFDPLRAEFPDWRLQIYGRGPTGTALAKRIADLGAGDQIELCGYARHFERVLARASCYAMGSFREGLPMVLLEAQASGLPVVAFDCPRGPADVVHDGVDGRLIDDGDIAGFTAALRQVMGDSDLRAAMGAKGRQNAEHYRIEAVTAQWESLFASLVAARREARRRPSTLVRRLRRPAAGQAAPR